MFTVLLYRIKGTFFFFLLKIGTIIVFQFGGCDIIITECFPLSYICCTNKTCSMQVRMHAISMWTRV